MVTRLLSALFLFTFLVTPLWAGTLSGTVIAVSDADTITMLVKKRQHKIRLAHIDAPETSQPYGTAARQALADLVFRKQVTVMTIEKDYYGRWIGVVLLPDGRSVNHQMVWAGHAWWYDEFSDDPVMDGLQAQARLAKVGLWADPNPVEPWVWRKEEKARRSQAKETR